jgi:basic membrane protein A
VINTQDKYPDTVVASALWNMEPTIDRALKLVKEGKFKAEDYGQYSMMKYKGSELAPLGTFEKKVPATSWPRSRPRKRPILDGKFTVKVDDSQPKSTRPQVKALAGACPSPERHHQAVRPAGGQRQHLA